MKCALFLSSFSIELELKLFQRLWQSNLTLTFISKTLHINNVYIFICVARKSFIFFTSFVIWTFSLFAVKTKLSFYLKYLYSTNKQEKIKYEKPVQKSEALMAYLTSSSTPLVPRLTRVPPPASQSNRLSCQVLATPI